MERMRAGAMGVFLFVVGCGRGSPALQPDLPFAPDTDRDYGAEVPCWCGTGPLQGVPVNCASAEEYLESVQIFGPPRGVVVGFTGEKTLDLEGTIE